MNFSVAALFAAVLNRTYGATIHRDKNRAGSAGRVKNPPRYTIHPCSSPSDGISGLAYTAILARFFRRLAVRGDGVLASVILVSSLCRCRMLSATLNSGSQPLFNKSLAILGAVWAEFRPFRTSAAVEKPNALSDADLWSSQSANKCSGVCGPSPQGHWSESTCGTYLWNKYARKPIFPVLACTKAELCALFRPSWSFKSPCLSKASAAVRSLARARGSVCGRRWPVFQRFSQAFFKAVVEGFSRRFSSRGFRCCIHDWAHCR